MLNVGIIGCGYWGPNLIRNFSDNSSTRVTYICDLDEQRLRTFKSKYPSAELVTDYKKMLLDDNLHLIAIATPVFTHFKLAYDALIAGKHVLLEKPFTRTVAEAEKLIAFADKQNLRIFVDHTFIYTGAVQKIKSIIQSRQVGDIYYFDSVRINLGLFQHDVNVIWDLAPHDLSIMDFLVSERPVAVSAIASCCVKGQFEDVAYVTVKFGNGLIAHFHTNWLSPVKIRRIIIGGSNKMIVFDDLNPDEKVKVYDKGVTLKNESQNKMYKDLIQYRIGDMHSPKIEGIEALKVELDHIAMCLKDKDKISLSDGEAGLRVVKLLEACEKSLKKNGTFVKI
jgi:predicted dehydrogenase